VNEQTFISIHQLVQRTMHTRRVMISSWFYPGFWHNISVL